MAASKIMVIRHAEKPDDSGNPPLGVDIDGRGDKESLTPRGWQRAGALATLFDTSNGKVTEGLAVPQHLSASAIARHSESERPEETVTPLSEKLNLKIHTDFDKDQYIDMIKDAMKKDGIVLVCWEHQDIPEIANEIMGNDTSVPQKWPGDRFDVVWVFDNTGNGYAFSQVPQQLLAGDQNTVIEQASS